MQKRRGAGWKGFKEQVFWSAQERKPRRDRARCGWENRENRNDHWGSSRQGSYLEVLLY